MADTQRFQRRIEILPMFDELVALRTGMLELFGIAHADQIKRDAPSQVPDMRHDVAPQVRRGWVAVLKYDRVALAHFDIGHLLAQHFNFVFPVLSR